MPYTQYIFFADDTVPKDDVDKLFEKLEQLEPPPTLIKSILKLTIEPSSDPAHSDLISLDLWAELDSLVIRNDKLNPS
jgi:hypothetical protein